MCKQTSASADWRSERSACTKAERKRPAKSTGAETDEDEDEDERDAGKDMVDASDEAAEERPVKSTGAGMDEEEEDADAEKDTVDASGEAAGERPANSTGAETDEDEDEEDADKVEDAPEEEEAVLAAAVEDDALESALLVSISNSDASSTVTERAIWSTAMNARRRGRCASPAALASAAADEDAGTALTISDEDDRPGVSSHAYRSTRARTAGKHAASQLSAVCSSGAPAHRLRGRMCGCKPIIDATKKGVEILCLQNFWCKTQNKLRGI